MSILEYLFVFAGVVLSGIVVLRMKISAYALKLLLAFSGAFLFSISVMELMPEIYSSGVPFTGVFILAGFLVQIIIEFFSKGIEHGHVHQHHTGDKRFPAMMMIALGVHSFLEGMPLAGEWPGDESLHRSLLTGIILHNVPVSIALVLLLREAGIKEIPVLYWLVGFALMTPAGAFVADLAGSGFAGSITNFFPYLMALVTGIFLHISTTILFESSENHRFNLIKLLVIILGAMGGMMI